MKYIPSYIIIFLLLFGASALNAQVDSKRKAAAQPNVELELQRTDHGKAITLPVRSAAVYMEATQPLALDPEQLDDRGIDALLSNQKANCKLVLTLFNPTEVARIHVRMGTAKGANDIAKHTFSFDQKSPAPFTFDREGRTVVLGMGTYSNLNTYYGEVVLEDLNGKRSAPTQFSAGL